MRTVSQRTYQQLKLCFGQWASWALWNPANIADLSIMEPRGIPHPFMRADLVFVGLNATRPLNLPWQNFHDTRQGARDFMLERIADNAVFGGAYITDIIKVIDPVDDSDSVYEKAKKDKDYRAVHAKSFCEEMRMLGVGYDTVFVVFGDKAADVLNKMKSDGLFSDCCLREALFRKAFHYSAPIAEETLKESLGSHIGAIIPRVSYSEE